MGRGGREEKVQRKQRITFVEIESQMLPNDGNNLKKLLRENLGQINVSKLVLYKCCYIYT